MPEHRPESGDPAAAGNEPGGRIASTLRNYLRSLLQIAGRESAKAVLVMFLASFTEGAGLALLLPLLQIAGFHLEQQGPAGRYAAWVQSLLAGLGVPRPMWLSLLLVIFVLLTGLRSLLSRAQSVLTFSATLKFELALSRRIYESILNTSWISLSRRRASDFTHALTAEVARVETATFSLLALVSSGMISLLYVFVALKLSATMTLLVLGCGLLLVLLTRGRTQAAHESGMAVSLSIQGLYAAATEHLQNLKTVKTLGTRQNDLAMFGALQERASREVLRNARSQASASFWFESGSMLLLGAIIVISLQWIGVAPAAVLLLLAVFTRLMPRVSSAYSQFHTFVSDLPAFANLLALEAWCKAAAEPPVSGAAARLPLRQALELDSVSFGYGDRPVLDRVSITLPAGKTTAILGASGAGKSTLADLMNGLLTPQSGRIALDGNPLTPEMARHWRSSVGYVAQDTVLFHDTVRANLLWVEPRATDDELRAVLEQAAAGFVFTLPRGLDTVVGDRGILLSNGQRQRIALARALLRKPALLVLDEATNSLDLENERHILDSIDRLKGRVTVLVIAHRFSAVERADQVYLLEDGRVAASGTWDEVRPSAAGMNLSRTGA